LRPPAHDYGDGTAVRDYVYIDGVVDAFMFAGQLPLEVMGTYNIGTGEQTTVSELYPLVAEAVGVSSPPRYAAVRSGEVHAIASDSKEAREELGGKPSIISSKVSNEPSNGYATASDRCRPLWSRRESRVRLS
jgi:UDP-glucose 4-epimerase